MSVGDGGLLGVAESVEHLPVPAYAIGIDGSVLAWNPHLAALTGAAGADMRGRKKGEYAVPFTGAPGPMLADLVLGTARIPPPYLMEVSRNGTALSARLNARGLGEGGRTFDVRAAPLLARGTVVGAVEVVLGPVQHHRGPRISDGAVLPLLQTVRHDIKNELTIVLGYLGLARDSIQDPTVTSGLDRALAAAGAIGWLIGLMRELEEGGEEPAEVRSLAGLVRDAAAATDLRGVHLEIDLAGGMLRADGAVFAVLEHLFERFFRAAAEAFPHPTAIRVTARDGDPWIVDARADLPSVDEVPYPAASPDPGRGIALLRDVLALDGIELNVSQKPPALELRIPRSRLGDE